MAICTVCLIRFKKEPDLVETRCRYCIPDNSYRDEDIDEEIELLLNPTGVTQVKEYEEVKYDI